MAWPFFFPQDHITCWIALDDATIANGCMTVIPQSFKWGPVATQLRGQFLTCLLYTSPSPRDRG